MASKLIAEPAQNSDKIRVKRLNGPVEATVSRQEFIDKYASKVEHSLYEWNFLSRDKEDAVYYDERFDVYQLVSLAEERILNGPERVGTKTVTDGDEAPVYRENPFEAGTDQEVIEMAAVGRKREV